MVSHSRLTDSAQVLRARISEAAMTPYLIEYVVVAVDWIPDRAGWIVEVAAAVVQMEARELRRHVRVREQRPTQLPARATRATGFPISAIRLRGRAVHSAQIHNSLKQQQQPQLSHRSRRPRPAARAALVGVTSGPQNSNPQSKLDSTQTARPSRFNSAQIARLESPACFTHT